MIVKDLKEAMDRYHSLFGIGPFAKSTLLTPESFPASPTEDSRGTIA